MTRIVAGKTGWTVLTRDAYFGTRKMKTYKIVNHTIIAKFVSASSPSSELENQVDKSRQQKTNKTLTGENQPYRLHHTITFYAKIRLSF